MDEPKSKTHRIKLTVSFAFDEADAIAKLAYSELRDPPDQVRFIVREYLRKNNLLVENKEESDNGRPQTKIT